MDLGASLDVRLIIIFALTYALFSALWVTGVLRRLSLPFQVIIGLSMFLFLLLFGFSFPIRSSRFNDVLKILCFLEIMFIECCRSIWPIAMELNPLSVKHGRIVYGSIIVLMFLIHSILAFYGLSRGLDGPWVSSFLLHLTFLALQVYVVVKREKDESEENQLEENQLRIRVPLWKPLLWGTFFLASCAVQVVALVLGSVHHQDELIISWGGLWGTCVLDLSIREWRRWYQRERSMAPGLDDAASTTGIISDSLTSSSRSQSSEARTTAPQIYIA